MLPVDKRCEIAISFRKHLENARDAYMQNRARTHFVENLKRYMFFFARKVEQYRNCSLRKFFKF